MKNKYVVSLIIDLVVIVMDFVLFKKTSGKAQKKAIARYYRHYKI